ncbi:hypothetical protein [Brevundimonas sp. NPDC058933]|uniref:hypothetical protein n=1 Tax=Brevundimonas sp. NPDC058933 TaxID=3346673 RepID=UPI003BEEB43E
MYVDLTFNTISAPMLAFYGPGAYGVLAVSVTGSTWKFRVASLANQTIGNPPFKWLLFDKPVVRSSGAGAEAFDASGNIVWSSFYPPLKVASFVGDGGASSGGYHETQLPSNRQYAVAFNAQITLYENSEHYTNQQVFTYWTYDFTAGYAETTASPYDATKKRCGITTQTINGGVNEGSQSPAYPSGDLGGWGSASSALILDVTGHV